jgi:hypothetical protein
MALTCPESVERPRPHPFNALEAKVIRLEARIARLETQAADFGWRGVWSENTDFKVGNFVTYAGALWHCQQPTRSRPGADSTWRLCVKNGTFTRY